MNCALCALHGSYMNAWFRWRQSTSERCESLIAVVWQSATTNGSCTIGIQYLRTARLRANSSMFCGRIVTAREAYLQTIKQRGHVQLHERDRGYAVRREHFTAGHKVANSYPEFMYAAGSLVRPRGATSCGPQATKHTYLRGSGEHS
jgi:hypothetical protein